MKDKYNIIQENPVHFTTDEAVHQAYLDDIAKYVGYFVENPYLRFGDSDSGHGVLFGKLDGYGDVAIKPFTALGRARHEAEVLEHVKTKGFDALTPLGISSEGIYAHLVTEYRPGLKHLGQVQWKVNVASPDLRNVIIPSLNFAGNFAGQLHSNGITHGDFQVKNVALRGDSPVVMDVENGQIRLSGNELHRKADADLATFAGSTIRRGILWDRSLAYRLKTIEEHFIEPALEPMDRLADPAYDRRAAIAELIAKSLLSKEMVRRPSSRKARKILKHK